MNVTVNILQAERILRNAISDVKEGNGESYSSQYEDIEKVITGTHLTYRYILMTALIAKATNDKCNPLALQAGAELNGAYDARSVCHKVLVPIERELLNGRLGSSNEPFLNKPARYQELSLSNAVRRGNDLDLLKTSIKILEKIEFSHHAYDCLKDAILATFKRKSKDINDYLQLKPEINQQTSFIRFAELLIEKSFEGETCSLLVGLTYNIMSLSLSKDFDVRVHKSNQAGSSSNEISDVDVYHENNLLYTVEVKDKIYSESDVNHAISKAVMSGINSIVFAVGPRGSLQGRSQSDLIYEWSRKGVNLFFVDVISHFTSTLSYAPKVELELFISFLNYHVDKSSIKDDTLSHIVCCIKKLDW